MKKYTLIGVLSVGILIFGGCSREATKLDCAHLPKEPANLGLLKEEIIKYHDSGAWDRATACVVEEAKKTLKKYLPVGKKPLAVVFDIDEAILTSWELMRTLDFGYNHDRYKEWELAAKSKPIEPMQDLYAFVKDNGFTTFFITGRRENERAATERNLQETGFGGWKELFLKPMDYKGTTASDYKSKAREAIREMGYTIVASFGDQASDFSGDPKALHNFKISNPVYIVP